MASFLAKQIPVLTKAVVTEEIPASERRANGGGAGAPAARARVLELACRGSAGTVAQAASSRVEPQRRSTARAGRARSR